MEKRSHLVPWYEIILSSFHLVHTKQTIELFEKKHLFGYTPWN